jgi:hypothetical protein
MYVTILNSQIDNNGAPPSSPRFGFDYNIYAGALTGLTVSNSYIHRARGGHEIKTRALKSVIANNTIEDGQTAQTSYSPAMSSFPGRRRTRRLLAAFQSHPASSFCWSRPSRRGSPET